jgi:transcriptional antiterminator
MQQIPDDFYLVDSTAAQDKKDPNIRLSLYDKDKEIIKKGEFFNGDEDQDTSKKENQIVNNQNHKMTDEDD